MSEDTSPESALLGLQNGGSWVTLSLFKETLAAWIPHLSNLSLLDSEESQDQGQGGYILQYK